MSDDIQQKSIRLVPHYPRSTIEARLSWDFNKYEDNGLVYLVFQGSGVSTTINVNEADALRFAHLIIENLEKKEAPTGALMPIGVL